MNYHIKRDLNEYGPYTLADLQRYVAQGNILLTDLARSEGMTDWVPVSQVLGDIPIPVPGPAMPGAGTVYGSPGYGVASTPVLSAGPVPPDFHWALVLLINYFCSLFGLVWLFVEAAFVRKIVPQSKAVLLLALCIVAIFVGAIILVAGEDAHNETASAVVPLLGFLFLGGGIVLYFVAILSMRSEIEDYYNTTENINLRLTGVGSTLLTLFFAVYYFQWHFSRIAKWKKTGVLAPQS
jgi:GYF domain 2